MVFADSSSVSMPPAVTSAFSKPSVPSGTMIQAVGAVLEIGEG